MANRIAKYLRNRIAAYLDRAEGVEHLGNETRYTIIEDGLELVGSTVGNQRHIVLTTGGECWAWIYHVTEHQEWLGRWARMAGDPTNSLTYYHAALVCKVARQIR